MYIKQIANTLQTFGECFLNTHEIGCEHSVNSPRPPRNGVRILRQFPTSTTKLVANIPPGVGADSSCPYPNITQNHIRITKYAYSHYQIRVYSLSNMHIHIINYVFSSHHAHIFALPYQYIRFLLFIILNIKQPNTAYIYT